MRAPSRNAERQLAMLCHGVGASAAPVLTILVSVVVGAHSRARPSTCSLECTDCSDPEAQHAVEHNAPPPEGCCHRRRLDEQWGGGVGDAVDAPTVTHGSSLGGLVAGVPPVSRRRAAAARAKCVFIHGLSVAPGEFAVLS